VKNKREPYNHNANYTVAGVVEKLTRHKLKVEYVSIIDGAGHKRVTSDIAAIKVRKHQTIGIKLLGMIDFLGAPIVGEGKK